jgi:hypothetical protein
MKKRLINYRIIGTSIIGSEKTVRECRAAIMRFYGPAKFEWWSEDGSRSGTATAK